jgi:O-antigen/teichoic acid export membrane protein
MSNKERQIKNSFIYLLPTATGAFLNVATLAIFTRILTKEDYGFLALAHVYGFFVTGLFNFGLLSIYERNFFECRDNKKTAELLYSILLFVLAGFFISAILTYIFKSPLSKLIIGTSEQADLLFWVLCSTGIMSFKQYYLTYFKNMENAKSFVWYAINASILSVAMSLFLVVYMRVGVLGLVLGQMLSSLVILFALTLIFLKTVPIAFSFNILKGSLKLSYPLTPSLMFKIVANQFDKYIIGLLGTVGGVGIYSIGQSIANVVFICMTAIQNVFSPQVYKRMFELGEDGGKAVGKYLTPFAYVSIAIAIIIALFAEEIVSLLAPKRYHGVTDIVIILSMLYGSYFFGKQPQLIYMKKTHISSMLSIFTAILNIVINIPFIIMWGTIGAAWGTLTAGLISGAISFAISQKYYEIKWEYVKICAIFLTFFASAMLMIVLRDFNADYATRLTFKGISIGVYIYLGIKFNVITMDNYRLIRNAIPIKQKGYNTN